MRAAFAILLLGALPSACGTKQPLASPEPVSSDPRVVLHRFSPFVMCEGQSFFATVTVAWDSTDPLPSTTPPDIYWATMDSTIATLNAHDEVEARKAGSTYLVATSRWGAVTATTRFPLKVLKGDIDPEATAKNHQLVCGRPRTIRIRS